MSDPLRKAAEMALRDLTLLCHAQAYDTVQALRQALKQPEQEPVAWVNITDEGKWSVRFAVPALSLPDGTKFYTAPPKREWVDLTDEEIDEVERWVDYKEEGSGPIPLQKLIQYIESKLKGKNT